LFTDYVSGPAVRYTYGWIFVATAIAPIFFVNLTYVFIQGAEIAKKKCKEMSIKRKKEADEKEARKPKAKAKPKPPVKKPEPIKPHMRPLKMKKESAMMSEIMSKISKDEVRLASKLMKQHSVRTI
jgi:type IV secretory pathway VirB10-like protein